MKKEGILMKTIDLFAGIGGIRLGFEKAGFSTIYANDIDHKCAITYNANFDNPKLEIKDIKKICTSQLPDFDFLLGGFPCQPFSVAGHKKGTTDKRGTLFFDILNIINDKKPVGFFLENVKNLVGKNFRETFNIMISALNNAGYEIKYTILNTADYGNIPQNRERVYIVGFKRNTSYIDKFTFPRPQKLTKTIKDMLLPENEIDSKYYYNNKPLFNRIKDFNFRDDTLYQWRRQYVRENKNNLCPTLTANMGTGGHNVPIVKDKNGIRKLTPRECANFQGFPKSYKIPKEIGDSFLYKQIGNSVSIPVVREIAKSIKRSTSF